MLESNIYPLDSLVFSLDIYLLSCILCNLYLLKHSMLRFYLFLPTLSLNPSFLPPLSHYRSLSLSLSLSLFLSLSLSLSLSLYLSIYLSTYISEFARLLGITQALRSPLMVDWACKISSINQSIKTA